MTATTTITEYSQTEAALATLAARYKDKTFAVATTAGMREATAARAELRGYRVGIEKTRKEIKEPALRHCQLIDSEAKRITLALSALEDPIDAQIKAEEQRKASEKAAREEAERVRVTRIQGLISRIRNTPSTLAGKTARQIGEALDGLRQIGEPTADAYQEFRGEATTVLSETIAAVATMRDETAAREAEQERVRQEQAAEAERIAAERVELDRLRKESEAREAELRKLREAEEARLRAAQDEADRKAKAEREAAEKVRREQEAEAARLDAERKEVERQKAEQAERERQAAERLAKLTKARRTTKTQALADILAICNDDLCSDAEARRNVALIAEASL